MSIKHCRCMFATHYHSLLSDWEFDPRVKLGHMNCLVHDNSHDDGGGGDTSGGDHPRGSSKDDGDGGEEVTFLYKLTDGSSPRSYGINVARLAGLPTAVITLALQQSRLFEDKMQKKNSSQHKHNHNGVDSDNSDELHHHRDHHYHGSIHNDKIRSIYERLVSLAGSTSSISELSNVAMEMWRRYQQLKKTT